MPFQPIDSRLYEQVADQIGGGEFLPGQRLPAERDLAKMLAVSRPVVREAMIALEIGGLIEVRTGSGAFVREKPAEPAEMVNSGHSPSDILSARICVRCWR
jgi:DNA-binding FadR family transcriptional regulator